MEKGQIRFQSITHRLETTDSTNNYLRDIDLPADVDFVCVTTEYQTAGRGQGSNHWESEEGKNLLFSLKCKPYGIKASEQFILLQTVSLAICNVLRIHLKDSGLCTIKWPNDIYYGDKKLSGTLSECTLKGGMVNEYIAGTGINVNQQSFKSDAPNPVSMANILHHELDRKAILNDIINEVSNWFSILTNGDYTCIKDEYEKHLYRRDGIHRYTDKDGEFEAAYETILSNGHLVLRRTDATLSEYEFKEVKFVI